MTVVPDVQSSSRSRPFSRYTAEKSMSEGASNFNNQFRQKNAQFRHPCFQPQVLLYNLRKVIGMLYQVQRQSGTRRFYTEVRSCIKIPYTTVREMKLRYPDESFIICLERRRYALRGRRKGASHTSQGQPDKAF